MNKNLLMRFEEYNKKRWEFPYCYILQKNDQYIYYFGSKHLSNPNDPQFEQIENFYSEFLAKTEGKDRITLVEGGNWPALSDKIEAITRYGESAYVAHLSAKYSVARTSPEPKEKERFALLLKSFSKEEIIYYEVARAAYQWWRKGETESFEVYVQKFLDMAHYQSGWNDFDFSLAHMKAFHQKFTGKAFDTADQKTFYDLINPTKSTTAINRLSRFEDEEYRDQHILGEIEKYWNEGKNIFIIYGGSHAVRQEPALKTLEK